MNFINKHWPGFVSVAIVAALFFGCRALPAQSVNVTGPVTITLPTQYTDNTVLAAADITGIQWFMSTAPIADTSTLAPTEVTGRVTSWTYTGSVPNGTTLYFRTKACVGVNRENCSKFSPSVSKLIQIKIPGNPTNMQVQFVITIVVDNPPPTP